MKEDYNKKLLEAANPSLIFKKGLKPKKYNWLIGWIRRVFKMEPKLIFTSPPLPANKGNTIKFRRYKPFKSPVKNTERGAT